MIRVNSLFSYSFVVLSAGLFVSACSEAPSDGAGPRSESARPRRPVLQADANGPVTVVLSEFVAANYSVLRDRDGDFSDWIELHNYGADPVQLKGCYLTDDPAEPSKWPFPDLVMASGEYLVIFASGKDEHTEIEFHTSFSLSAQGEYLGLIGRDGQTVVDDFGDQFPKQRNDVAYGLVPGWTVENESADFQGYLLEPTPGQANAETLLGDVAGVKFSHERGFYDEGFELSLTCRTSDAVIRYTVDGTLPSLENGIAYAGPIAVGETTVLKVAAFKAQHRPSRVKTKSYVLPSDVARQSLDGLPPEGFPFHWGSNRLDYGMDPKIVDDHRYRDELVAGLRSLPSFSIVMDLDDMFDAQQGIYANPQQDGRDWERPCSVEYFLADGTEGFQ